MASVPRAFTTTITTTTTTTSNNNNNNNDNDMCRKCVRPNRKTTLIKHNFLRKHDKGKLGSFVKEILDQEAGLRATYTRSA